MRRLIALFVLSLLLVSLFQVGTASAQTDQSTGTRKVLNKVVPAYPPMARTMNLSGTVKLEALVLADGKAKSVQVKGGNPLLAQAAQNAVLQWKWEKSEHESTEAIEFKFNP